jgi:predicted RNA polymerase sigma factor
MAQRLSRAKQTIKAAGTGFPSPAADERGGRLPAVLHVLYLIFSEGYAASSGGSVTRVELSAEAIRVARLLAQLLPEEPEVTGLLALMLFTDARRGARTGANGELIPLDEQDRSSWDRAAIGEGERLLQQALSRGVAGPFQIQAAIAALHDAAASTGDTDWAQILALYGLLRRFNDSPMVRLSEAIALAMVDGPEAGLAALDALAADPRLSDHHRLDAARGHLLERAGASASAAVHFRRAAERTTSMPERHYLMLHAARLGDHAGS